MSEVAHITPELITHKLRWRWRRSSAQQDVEDRALYQVMADADRPLTTQEIRQAMGLRRVTWERCSG